MSANIWTAYVKKLLSRKYASIAMNRNVVQTLSIVDNRFIKLQYKVFLKDKLNVFLEDFGWGTFCSLLHILFTETDFFKFIFHDFLMLIINVNILDYWNFFKLFQGYLYPMARRMPVRLEKWRSGKEKSITFVPDLLFLYPAVHVIAVSPVWPHCRFYVLASPRQDGMLRNMLKNNGGENKTKKEKITWTAEHRNIKIFLDY